MENGPSTLLCFRGAFLSRTAHSFRRKTHLQESSASLMRGPAENRWRARRGPAGPGGDISDAGPRFAAIGPGIASSRFLSACGHVLYTSPGVTGWMPDGTCGLLRPSGKNQAKVMKALRNPLRPRKTISTVRQHPCGTFRRSYSFPVSSLHSFCPSYGTASFSRDDRKGSLSGLKQY